MHAADVGTASVGDRGALNGSADRRAINLGGGDLHRMADEAWAALVAANDEREPRMLVRGNELVRMTERGELEPYTIESLRDELSRVAGFYRETQTGPSPKTPPVEIARVLLARDSGEYVGAPRVDRVVDVPVLAADGSLITEPGHHPASRLFYRPADDLAAVEPGDVTNVLEVASARSLLWDDLLGDFAFADPGSKANALALLLLPFVREYIGDAPTPLHLIVAPEPGTGKSWLAQAALLPGCGQVPVEPEARSDDEYRKRITATLMRGSRAIVLDNLRRSLDSGPLAAAITTGLWRDRVLGESREVVLPVRNAWVATGNNLNVSDELARRAVPIFLDPGEVRPADRDKSAFRHPDLLRWVGDHRAELVSAALTLVQHWLEGEVRDAAGNVVLTDGNHCFYREYGHRVVSERTLGSFERYAEVVGGILAAAGVSGFLGNRARLFEEANEEGREAIHFLREWHKHVKGPVTVAELAQECRPLTPTGDGGSAMGPLHHALPTELVTGRVEDLQKKLAYWLRERRGRQLGGYQLLRDENSRQWWVRKTKDDAA